VSLFLINVIFDQKFSLTHIILCINTRTADGVILIPKAKKVVANFLPIDLAYKKFLTFCEI